MIALLHFLAAVFADLARALGSSAVGLLVQAAGVQALAVVLLLVAARAGWRMTR